MTGLAAVGAYENALRDAAFLAGVAGAVCREHAVQFDPHVQRFGDGGLAAARAALRDGGVRAALRGGAATPPEEAIERRLAGRAG